MISDIQSQSGSLALQELDQSAAPKLCECLCFCMCGTLFSFAGGINLAQIQSNFPEKYLP